MQARIRFKEASARFFVPTFFVAALHAGPCLLTIFFDKERGVAIRAWFIHRTIPDGELAPGIITTRIEGTPLLRALLSQISAVLRAFDAERNGFGRLAFWIG